MSNLVDANPVGKGATKNSSRLQELYYTIIPFIVFQIYRMEFRSLLKIPRFIISIFKVIIFLIIKRTQEKEQASYDIRKLIASTTTQIFFAQSKRIGIDICMKLWPKRKSGNSSLEDPSVQVGNLLEGFAFNQRFAPGVYLGIAAVTIQEDGAEAILRGDLIFRPTIDNVKPGEYVLVMRDIKEKWKLDNRLKSKRSSICTKKGMQFLAKETARMHKQLEPSQEKGHPDIIASKLAFNIQRLGQAIDMLDDASMKEKYDRICRMMNTACTNYRCYFEQRRQKGAIRRCHGDLKTTNLWVSPWKILPRKLFALDCIDFNADFCHIDTLSDIAMLVVDMQQVMRGVGEEHTEELITHFIKAYCKEMQENDVCVQPLLQYYMTEKAMVCAYVSLLLDDALELGKRYFSIAYILAQRLEQLPIPPVLTPSSEQELSILVKTM